MNVCCNLPRFIVHILVVWLARPSQQVLVGGGPVLPECGAEGEEGLNVTKMV